MAALITQEAPSSTPEYSYHVFLSFRGTDTRKKFTDHLYEQLKWQGIRTFRDDDAIRRGEKIESEIKKAIQESKMSLIIFSADYASSSYCLDEVVMIMEHREAAGHIVLPVFYEVDPSEVAEQTGKYANAFSKHAMEFMADRKRVEGWRAALRKVTDLAGMVLHGGYEAQFIQDIVKEVGKKLKRKILQVPTYLVGVDSNVKDIDLWLQNTSNIGFGGSIIYGIAGVGKTTISKLVFNMNFEKFDSWSFLMDIREALKQSDGLVKLQSQLLSDILKGKTSEIHNADEGLAQIRDALRNKRVLIVLDDVDDEEQLRSIIARSDWLYAGSKIIVTTRRNRLLSYPEGFAEFRVEALNYNDSLQLFSWHAFRAPHPPKGYRTVSMEMVKYCDGVPLALTVLGSSLCGRDEDFWYKAMQEPAAIGDGKIQKIVGISYHSLRDDRDRTLFLDIASILMGEDVGIVETLIESCNFYRKVGLDELIDRNLVIKDKDDKLTMHPLVWDMATEIVRAEAPEDLGQRTRIWDQEDAVKVLRNGMGTKTVKSLILRLSRVTPDPRDVWTLNTEAFANMTNLRLLHLKNVRLVGECKHLPKGLVYLRWHGFPYDTIPFGFALEDLVVLDLSKSILTYAWDGIRVLPNLKVLNLSRCESLIRTPDFRGLLCLEVVTLMGCISLVEVDRSILCLPNLICLDLVDCISVRWVPMLNPRTLVLTGLFRFYYQFPNQMQLTYARQPQPLEYLYHVGNAGGGNAGGFSTTVKGPPLVAPVRLSWRASVSVYEGAGSYNNPRPYY